MPLANNASEVAEDVGKILLYVLFVHLDVNLGVSIDCFIIFNLIAPYNFLRSNMQIFIIHLKTLFY